MFFHPYTKTIVFLRNLYNRKSSPGEADQEQKKFTDELKNSTKIRIKAVGLLLEGKEEVLAAFEGW